MSEPRHEFFIVSGDYGEVWFARGGPGPAQFEALPIHDRIKLKQRFRSVVCSAQMVSETKLRRIRGSDGVYEFKLRNPPLRAFAFIEFRRGVRRWRITHITRKPKERLVLREAEYAERVRRLHESIE